MKYGCEITMRPYEIAKAILTWHGGCYFIGDACGECNCTVNTFGCTAYGPAGWFCPNPECDHYNIQPCHGGMMPWDRPDYGPTKRIIHKGGKLSQRDTLRGRRFMDDQKVLVNLSGGSYYIGGYWHPARIVNMQDDCYCGMRWYNVVLQDGTKRILYEKYIRRCNVLRADLGGGTVFIELSRENFPPALN